MKIVWQIEPEDAAKVKEFFERHRDDPLVKRRIETNLNHAKPPVAKEAFWECMIACLLTTQQRSGPESPVTRFLRTQPFLLRYAVCREQSDPAEYARKLLSKFGGLRFSNKIGEQVRGNLSFLETGGWEPTFAILDKVRLDSRPETEREAARHLDEHLSGFGPKQARNLMQGLGLSRFEIPIDSRITKWLNDHGFPVRLSAKALQDSDYYEFVSDGFQRLCEACGIFPCVLDAAIFTSFDNGGWTPENLVW